MHATAIPSIILNNGVSMPILGLGIYALHGTDCERAVCEAVALGYRLFGLCLFSAGVSSVVGAAFTSVSFLKTLHPFINKYERQFVVGFIAFSTLMMVIVGNAAQLLIIAGAFNGLILPITLGVMLIASRSKRIVGSEYKHPMPLIILGAIVVLISLYSGVQAVPGILDLFG